MSENQSGSDGGHAPRGTAKPFSLWPIAITVIVVAVLLFGVYVVNRVLGALEKEKKAEMLQGAIQRVVGIEGEKVVPAREDRSPTTVQPVEGEKGPSADDYGSHISFSLSVTPKQVEEGERLVVVRGTVRNDGDRGVVFLKVGFSFLDGDGKTVFYDDDLVAHQYPFGSNKTRVPAHGQKTFDCDWWVPTSWDGKSIKTEVLEVGLASQGGR